MGKSPLPLPCTSQGTSESPPHLPLFHCLSIRLAYLLFLLFFLAILLPTPPLRAASLYWDGTSSSWNLPASWSTSASAATPDPAAPPGFNDLVTFNISTLNSPQTITLDAPQTASGLIFASTGTVTLQSGAGINALSTRSNGITINAGAGANILAAPVILTAATQTWTNNSTNLFTVSGDLAFGADALSLAGTGNFTLGGTLTSNPSAPAGALSLLGSGTVHLTGANTFLSSISVSAGTLILGNPAALGSASGATAVSSAGTLDLGGQNIGDEPLSLQGSGTGTIGALINSSPAPAFSFGTINAAASSNFTVGGTGDITLSGSFNSTSGASLLIKLSSNTLTLAGSTDNPGTGVTLSAGSLILAKASSPTVHAIGTNGLTISGGTAQLAGSGGDQIADSATVTLSGGIFDLGGQNESFDVLNHTAGTLTNTAPATLSTLTLGTAGGSSSVSGNLQNGAGALALIKIGAGNLTLSGTSTFTGPLTISAGSLTLTGGSLTTNVINRATFIYSGGQLNGRLTNAGTLTLNANLSLSDGLENDATLSLPAGRTLTLAGAGLDNQGLLSFSGGTLILSGTSNINRGTFNLASSVPFDLGSATLTNQGTFNLNTTSILGASAQLTNSAGGSLVGPGAIFTPFANAGGLITAPAGTLNITHDFANSGAIALTSSTSSLSGGAISNTGSLRGQGTLGNPILNGGSIEPLGGTLYLAGALTNSAAGTLRISAGNQLVILPGLSANSGLLSLTGGTFDNNNHPLTNNGQISGFGTLSTSGLTNNASFTLTGGLSTINGPVTNAPGKTLNILFNPAVFTGDILNNGTIKTTATTVTFSGNYTGNAFLSDPSTNIFQANLTISSGGLMSGGTGDRFLLSGGTFSNLGTFSNAGTLQSADPVLNAGSFSQSGPQLWSPGTLFTNTGSATFASDTGNSSSAPLSISSSGTLLFLFSQHLGQLSLTAGLATVRSGATTLLSLSLNHTGPAYAATLDLTAGKLILQSTDPNDKATKISQLSAAIKSGSNAGTGGAWTGQGITSSTAALDPQHYAVALFDNAILQLPAFGNQPTDQNSLLMTIAHLGDANANGIVDIQDQSIITNNWQKPATNWASGDLNLDGFVDIQDLTLVTNNWQQQSSFSQNSGLTPQDSGPTPIPEPTTLLLLLNLPLVLFGRRKNDRNFE